MGSCFSIRFYGFGSFGGFNRSDLNGSTFSHYSLTSDNSCLDLYPTLKYMEYETETEASSMVSVSQGISHFKNWNNNSVQGTVDEEDSVAKVNVSNTAVLIETWDDVERSRMTSQSN